MQPAAAVILAGGLGRRLRARVADLPKPMAPVAGRPFLARLMELWIKKGMAHFILSVGYKGEIIRDFFGDEYKGAKVTYVEEDTPLGTGGAIIASIADCDPDAPLFVMNGDSWLEIDVGAMVALYNQREADMVLALRVIHDAGRYGVVEQDGAGRIIRFREKEEGVSGRINGGVYLFKPSLLLSLGYGKGEPVSLEETLFPRMIADEKKLFGALCDGAFIDIGVPDDYDQAQTMPELIEGEL